MCCCVAALVCGFNFVVSAEEAAVDIGTGDGISPSEGPDVVPSPGTAANAVGTVYLGPMCPADFKVSEGAAGVVEAVGDFCAPPLLRELFRKATLRDMIWGIEANAVKVWLRVFTCILLICILLLSGLSPVQSVMLARAIDDDIARGFAEIQGWVNAEHAHGQVWCGERDSLAVRVKTLEAQVVGLETERQNLRSEVEALQGAQAGLQEEVKTLRGSNAILEEEIETERSVSNAFGLGAWKVMESLEGAVEQLGVVPPARVHRPTEMDITLARLQKAVGICLPAARAYGDHCAKAAWTTTLASLDKAGCAHIDALATGSVAVATAAEVTAAQRRTRGAGKALLRDFWDPRGHDAATESFLAVQAKRRAPADDAGGSAGTGKRGSTGGDKV